MKRIVRALLACTAVVLPGLLLSACGGGSAPPGKDATSLVSCVDGVPIRRAQLQEWRSLLTSMSPTRRARFVPPGARSLGGEGQARAFLTAASVVIAEARKLGVRPGTDSINPADMQGLQLPAATASLEPGSPDAGLAARQFLLEVRTSDEAVAAWARSQAEKRIPSSRIASYYDRRRDTFFGPERRDVAVIETFKKSKIEQAKRELESGVGFITVMLRRNDETAVGGLKRGITKADLRHRYEQDYFEAKPHTVVGPRKSEIYYMFEVVSTSPAGPRPLKDVQASIRRRLVSRSDLKAVAHLLEARLAGSATCRSE